jgi:hypothetical protein
MKMLMDTSSDMKIVNFAKRANVIAVTSMLKQSGST